MHVAINHPGIELSFHNYDTLEQIKEWKVLLKSKEYIAKSGGMKITSELTS